MAEEILYEAGVIKITPTRIVNGGSTYAVANVSSVKALNDNKLQICGVIAVFVGIAIAGQGNLLAIVLGSLAIIGGLLFAIFGRITEIMITTNATEQQAFRSRNEKVALQVASAINLAIMKRSAR